MARVRTGRELTAALKGIGKDTTVDLDKILAKLSMDAHRGLVRVSPVDTGFLRSLWSVTAGRPTGALTSGVKGSSYSAPSFPGLRIKWGQRIAIYNNAEYAYYIEHGSARSRAQPMVSVVYPRTVNAANRVLKALSKKRIP